MKAKGKKYLRITGFLEILMGVASLLMMFWILKQDPADFNVYGVDVKETLWLIALIYIIAGFKILAGFLGIIFANKTHHAKLCKILGIILILLQAMTFSKGDFKISDILWNTIALIVPVYYFYGASLNNKQNKEIN